MRIFRGIWRVLKWTLISVLLLVILTSVVFSISAVQTKTAKWAVGFLESEYGVEVSIAKAAYRFPNRVHLYEVYAPDHRGDTLIYAEEIRFVFTDFSNNRLFSEFFSLSGGKLFLKKYAGEEVYNMQQWLGHFNDDKPLDPNRPKFGISADVIIIDNFHFKKEPLECDSCTHLNFREAEITVSDFDLSGAYVLADIERLEYVDDHHFNVYEFRARAAYQSNYMALDNLYFRTDESEVSGSARLDYRTVSDFGDFVNVVRMKGKFNKSNFSSAEFQSYIPQFPDFDVFNVNGQFHGTVNNFYADRMDVRIGNTTFFGDVHLLDCTIPDKLYLDAFVGYCRTDGSDLSKYLTPFISVELPEHVLGLSEIDLSGHFEGTLRDFNTQGDIATNLGKANVSLAFVGLDNLETVRYDGNLKLDNFHLGKLLQVDQLGAITAGGEINGTGLTAKSAKAELLLEIPEITFMDYIYRNLNVDGRAAERQFIGNIRIRDPEVKFDFDGELDFSSDTAVLDFEANFTNANLYALGFVSDSATWLTAKIQSDFNMKGLEWWQGIVILDSLKYSRGGQDQRFKQFVMTSSNAGNVSRHTIESDLLSGYIEGEYRLLDLYDALRMSLSKINSNYSYHDEPVDVNCEFALEIRDFTPLGKIFVPALKLNPGTNLSGRLRTSDGSFVLKAYSSGLSIVDNQLDTVRFHLDGQSGLYKTRLLFDKMLIDNNLEVKNFSLNADLHKDSTDFQLDAFVDDTVDTHVTLQGSMLQPGAKSLAFQLRDMVFNIGYDTLQLQPGNRVVIDSSRIGFKNVSFQGEGTGLKINGYISDQPYEVLRLNLDRMDMSLVNYLLRSDKTYFQGTVTGDLIFNDLFGTPKAAAGVFADSLSLNHEWIGDVETILDWDVTSNRMIIDGHVMRGNLESLQVSGVLNPDSAQQIDLDMKLNRFRIASLNPYMQGILDNLRGMLDGVVKVGGTFDEPTLDGELFLPGVAFSIPFTGTDYNFEGRPRVTLTSDRIELDRVQLRDTKMQTTGYASGYVSHNNLKDINFNLRIDADHLLGLNTMMGENNYFYGTAYTSGIVQIVGPTDEMELQIDVIAERGTKVRIPLSSPTEISQNSIVTFVDAQSLARDSVTVEERSKGMNTSGLSIEVNVQVKPEAEIQLLMDDAVGGEILGQGEGLIRIAVSPSGELSILGTYTVAEGHYIFNMRNLVQKRFYVLPGSTLMWTGDPFGAQIDMNARYTTRTVLYGMVSEGSGYNGQRVEVNLLMHLTGDLMNPDIEFDIEVPGVNSAWQEEINNRLSDRDKLMDNAFSLLITNSFWNPENNIASDVYQQNITQLGSLISNWVTRSVVGDFVDVSLDYNTYTDENLSSEVEVGLRKALFNERWIINTRLDVPVAGSTTQTGERQAFTTDVEVEYKITEDGRFRAKAFNRSNQNNPGLDLLSPYTQGVGIYYRIDFDTWGGLMRSIFTGEKEKPETPETPGDSTATKTEDTLP